MRYLVLTKGACTILSIAIFSLGCSGSTIRRIGDPPPLPQNQRALQIIVQPADADISIDGKYYGSADRYRAGWMAIPNRSRRVKLHKPGYYAAYRLLSTGASSLRIKTQLLPVPTLEDK